MGCAPPEREEPVHPEYREPAGKVYGPCPATFRCMPSGAGEP